MQNIFTTLMTFYITLNIQNNVYIKNTIFIIYFLKFIFHNFNIDQRIFRNRKYLFYFEYFAHFFCSILS